MKSTNTNRWRRQFRNTGVLVLGITLGLALVAGCSAPKDSSAEGTAPEEQIKTVKVAAIGKMQIADPDEVVAEVQPSLQMDVILKVDGDVKEVRRKRGEFVKEGEIILTLDKEDALRNLEKAKLGVIGASESLKKARQDLENNIGKLETQYSDVLKQYNKMRNDYDLGLVDKFQLEQMESNVNNLKRDLDTLKNTNAIAGLEVQQRTAELNLADMEKMIGYYDVRAPIGGILTELPVEEKMTLGRGFRVAQIQQLDPAKVRADLSETAYKLVEGKRELTVYIPGDKEKFSGKVTYLSPVINAQTKAYTLELEVPNATMRFRPGMRVQVQLNDEKDQEVVVVPTTSVVREGNDTFVFIVAGDQAEKRKVELGRMKELYQEAISGVKPDEQIVVSGQHQLKDGEKVKVRQEEPK